MHIRPASSHGPRARVALLLRLSLAVAIAATLAACGGSKPPAQPAPTTQVPAGGAPPPATAPPAEPAPAPAPVPQVKQASVPEMLKSASAAVAQQHLVQPAGDSAMEYYVAVLDKDANNVLAKQAIVDIFPTSASIAEREISQRHLDEADRIVKLLDKASPSSYTVTTLKSKLSAMQQTVAKEQAQQLAQQQAAQQAQAQKAAEAAAAARAPAPEPAPARPTPAPPREAPAVASTTPPPSTTAPPPPPKPVAPAGETRDATIVRQVPPEYPPDAFRKRTEGWVELEFTVGVDGRVSNINVSRSQPSHVFDREAMRAMQQWTFQPALKDGKPVEAHLRRRVEFKLGG